MLKNNSQISSTEITNEIRKTFENAGDNVSPIVIKSAKELNNKFEEIESCINNEKSDWNVRVNAMTELSGLINGGALKKKEIFNNLPKISSGLIRDFKDTRGAVVKSACLLVSHLARVLKSDFKKMGDLIFSQPYGLSSQTSHGTQIISDSCKLTILNIAKYCQCKEILNSILKLADKNMSESNRIVSAEAINIILENWDINIIDNNYGTISKATKNLLSDKSNEARAFARKAAILLINNFPMKKDEFLSGLEDRVIKQLGEDKRMKEDSYDQNLNDGKSILKQGKNVIETPKIKNLMYSPKCTQGTPKRNQKKQENLNKKLQKQDCINDMKVSPCLIRKKRKLLNDDDNDITVLEMKRKNYKISNENEQNNKTEVTNVENNENKFKNEKSFKLRQKSPIKSQIPDVKNIKQNKFRNQNPSNRNRKISPLDRSRIDKFGKKIITIENDDKLEFLSKISEYVYKNRCNELYMEKTISGLLLCAVNEDINISSNALKLIHELIKNFPNDFDLFLSNLFDILFNKLANCSNELEKLILIILKEIESKFDPNTLLELSSKQEKTESLQKFVYGLCIQKDANLSNNEICRFITDITFSLQNDVDKIQKILSTIEQKNPSFFEEEIKDSKNYQDVQSIFQNNELNSNIPVFTPRDVLKWCQSVLEYVSQIDENQWNNINQNLYKVIKDSFEETNDYNAIFGLIIKIMNLKGIDVSLLDIFLYYIIQYIKDRRVPDCKILFNSLKSKININTMIDKLLTVLNNSDNDIKINGLYIINKLIQNDNFQQIEDILDTLTESLNVYINNEDHNVRRYTVYCYVSLYFLFDDKIDSYTDNLTINQQKIIQLYRTQKKNDTLNAS